tara:strand:- start:49 stop:150 length:102 start_codon:yes stop_codon:yes gene_type:complete
MIDLKITAALLTVVAASAFLAALPLVISIAVGV